MPDASQHPLYERLPVPPALVVFDFDGVMTDNAVWVAEDGREGVRCSRGDGMGITLLRRAGIPVLVLSTETNVVVLARCRKLKIECIHGCVDKTKTFQQVLAERHLDVARVVFVGNDVNDVGCLQAAGCGVVVGDAHPEAQAAADGALQQPGGNGAVREICDLILAKLEARPAQPNAPTSSKSEVRQRCA
jgi:YrbI family 3-deoxy-D-manno-octulosonate 8-phosphate phosphatase